LEAAKLAEFERHVRSVYKQTVRISIERQWARFCAAAGVPNQLRRIVPHTGATTQVLR
jgi:hypothetical protein